MVTIISATNRPGSSTYKLASYYQKRLADKGLETGLLSLMQLPATLIATDLYGKEALNSRSIQNVITQTEKFFFVIPEYNGSFPGVLKTIC